MLIDTNNLVSISEANQNFSKIARMVDETGSVVILKNNVPKYIVLNFDQADKENYLNDSELLGISDELMKKNKQAYEVLAK
ncbi:MAG: type II toxin-antitoxin system Phd/YefM family antitoxin [Selenomonas sp.]|nr:type II toxin-antitoxin system Phd/YefM family antitoxin [Selenomonas sp.]